MDRTPKILGMGAMSVPGADRKLKAGRQIDAFDPEQHSPWLTAHLFYGFARKDRLPGVERRLAANVTPPTAAMLMADTAVLFRIPMSSLPRDSGHQINEAGGNHASFGRSRSRRGLASALIGEIAAVIDDMEGFEEFGSLRIWRSGPTNILTSSALSHCRSSRFTNQMRIDWICSMPQFSDRLLISSRVPEALPGTCTRLRRPKINRRSCASSTRSTRKRKSTAFRNWVMICCVICESSYPKSSPDNIQSLTARRSR